MIAATKLLGAVREPPPRLPGGMPVGSRAEHGAPAALPHAITDHRAPTARRSKPEQELVQLGCRVVGVVRSDLAGHLEKLNARARVGKLRYDHFFTGSG